MRFADIKTDHMQNVIDKSGKNYPMLKKVKILYNQLFKYAMERYCCKRLFKIRRHRQEYLRNFKKAVYAKGN